MEVLVLLLVVRLLEARKRLEARLEHRAVAFLALRRDFQGEVREHRLQEARDVAEVLDGIDLRVLSRDDEEVVDSARANRLRLEADLVQREVAPHGARVLAPKVAVPAVVDARVADV